MILQNDFARQWWAVGPKVVAAVQRVGASGWYILGDEVERFEKVLAEFSGVKHAVGVGNGIDALEIALRCLDIRSGDKVLTTPLSAFATTLAIIRAHGIPIFADVDDTGNIDLEQCRTLLARDRVIRFFLPVHLYGNPVDLDSLASLKNDFELSVVEDCAQAIGARSRGRLAGTVGQVAGISFYPTKNLGALGDGGALLTNDSSIAERAKGLRNYGQSSLYVHSELGLNSRLDELQAAILRDALLPNLDTWTRRRIEIAARYQSGIRHPDIQVLPVPAGSGAVWHLFPVLVREGKRDLLREHLGRGEIATGIHYPRIIPEQPALKDLPPYENAPPAPKAGHFSRCELSLPIHPFLTNDEVDAVIGACNAWEP
jgi:dTDP-4-amino-4,6-dideoxygalactose transaminase